MSNHLGGVADVYDAMGELWKLAWGRLSWLFNIRLVPGKPLAKGEGK